VFLWVAILIWPYMLVFFFQQVYGATYLQKLLEPLLRTVITSSEWQHVSFEVDPTRFETQRGEQMYLFIYLSPSHRDSLLLVANIFLTL